ncbi:hypothetical protein [Sphingosinicella sp. BN140058]|uniref:hypothetical protein n=1 Tax=Sphingosinicella sp. BN140058 TaxID=1892855 RepID=UPI00101012B5|nr:hypothetical protein [Sphingosinicella sp. BN140058]QAY78274.1 hypothetical protein ETR14_18335 [Sphingosinicella sp. BN140058]
MRLDERPWEYPSFYPDDLPGQRALPYQFEDKTWDPTYSEAMMDAYRNRRDGVCFRIVGVGFVAPHKATSMWPADEQFVFTRVVELDEMPSEEECARRPVRNTRK